MSGLREKVSKLRSQVHSLAENHIPVIPLVIYLLTQPLPRLAPLIFDLFIEDEEALIRAKRKYEEKNLGDEEYQ